MRVYGILKIEKDTKVDNSPEKSFKNPLTFYTAYGII